MEDSDRDINLCKKHGLNSVVGDVVHYICKRYTEHRVGRSPFYEPLNPLEADIDKLHLGTMAVWEGEDDD